MNRTQLEEQLTEALDWVFDPAIDNLFLALHDEDYPLSTLNSIVTKVCSGIKNFDDQMALMNEACSKRKTLKFSASELASVLMRLDFNSVERTRDGYTELSSEIMDALYKEVK